MGVPNLVRITCRSLRHFARTEQDTKAVITAMAKHLHEQVENGASVMRFNQDKAEWELIVPPTLNPFNPFDWNDWVVVGTDTIPNPGVDKSLILIADWIKNPDLFNAGFTEAAADSLFAAMVKLDQKLDFAANGSTPVQYNDKGELLRRQGAIFNSPLHFIGFGQGVVVNTEIVQRIGVYYPNAGGAQELENGVYQPIKNSLGNTVRDLHFTAVDPIHYPSIQVEGNYLNILDPYIRVWDNVTFADKYYINRPARTGNDLVNITGIVEDAIAEGGSADTIVDLVENALRSLSGIGVVNNLREIAHALIKEYASFDLSVDLNNRYGFAEPDPRFPNSNASLNALNWYAGTMILNGNGVFSPYRLYSQGDDPNLPTAQAAEQARAVTEFWNTKDFIYRRLGDFPSTPDVIDRIEQELKNNEFSSLPWYSPDHALTTLPHGHKDASWEGVGTGWAHSLLGGGTLLGYALRPYTVPGLGNAVKLPLSLVPLDAGKTLNEVLRRTSVYEDNTYSSLDTFLARFISNLTGPRVPEPKQGDYAVPTLFNGNFDAITGTGDQIPTANLGIPGWSLYNGGGTSNDRLQSQLARNVGLNNTYSFRLGGGTNTLTHNSFVVPDWGALRFDLHVPQISGGELTAVLNVNGTSYTLGVVDLEVGDRAQNTVAYGVDGFETFVFDVPNEYRGKAGTLSFNLTGSSVVYLDNVAFKSQHLLFGNPTEARHTPERISLTGSPRLPYDTNYLLEKGQFSLSYNDERKHANWVSWQLDKSWLPSTDLSPEVSFNFRGDTQLPSGWYQVPGRDGSSNVYSPYEKGHLAPNADRNRNSKDMYSTYVTTNAIPSSVASNDTGSPWNKFEKYLREIAINENKEIQIIAGGYGSKETLPLPADRTGGSLNVPDYLWKIALITDPHPLASEISSYNPSVLAIMVPNTDGIRGITGAINLPTGRTVNLSSNTQWSDWNNWRVNGNDLESILTRDFRTKVDFFSSIRSDIQEQIEEAGVSRAITSPLMASSAPDELFPFLINIVGNSSALESGTINTNVFPFGIGQIGINKTSTVETSLSGECASEICLGQIGIIKPGTVKLGVNKTGFGQIGITETSAVSHTSIEIGLGQIGTREVNQTKADVTEISPNQGSPIELSVGQQTLKLGLGQYSINKFAPSQESRPQIDSLQINSLQVNPIQINASEISFSSSITLQQFLSSHNYTLQNTTIPTWTSFLTGTTPFNLNIEVTDLPTGQLAEAQLTSFSPTGTPNAGTLLLDYNGNDLGWFIDSTPWENSEFAPFDFAQGTQPTAFRATSSSPAAGHYDLLTTLLHELGHLAGLIQGNPAYDSRIQLLNGTPTFVGNGFSAILTPDGSHLSSSVYAYDLMNTTLTPGVRKLPSQLNLQMLQALQTGSSSGTPVALTAPLTAGALTGINNGDFTTATAWSQRGAAQILNGQAVLSEASPYLSNFKQTFIIPEGARSLQFTLTDIDLDASDLAPGDAFEAALLDAQTHQSLVGTATGLTQTDAFFNLQHTGNAYFSNRVSLAGVTTSGSLTNLTGRTVKVDLTGIAPGTTATLYFDLLGFGSQAGSVSIDDVRILTQGSLPPIAGNDTATTVQGSPILIPVLANDSDADGSLNPASLEIAAPSHGTVSRTAEGQLSYLPNPGFVGTDSFTYQVQDDSGNLSNPATVSVTVSNAAPVLVSLTPDPDLREGTPARFTAVASDPGHDPLTYTWNFGDGTTATGATVSHTFADNGTYTTTLTVTDGFGGSTTRSLPVVVNNLAPLVSTGPALSTAQGQPLMFSGSFTDAGRLDTHTVTWDFGDGSDSVTGSLTPHHTYTRPGSYTATLTVTDNDGGTSSQSVGVTVTNQAPSITSITTAGHLSEGQSASFSATASDPGNDDLTYLWNFGDGSTPVTGATVNHTYTDNGTYTTTLVVTDLEGAFATQTQTVTVNNLAPVVNAGADQSTRPGQALNFSGSFTDPGIFDTPTATWDFGDGSAPLTGTLTPRYAYSAPGTYTATLTVVDKDGAIAMDTLQVNVAPFPTLSVSSPTLMEGDSGSTLVQFVISLSAPSPQTVTVAYRTADGTAVAGEDYTDTSGTMTFAPGQTTQTVFVAVLGDLVDEWDETLTLNLSAPTNATFATRQGIATLTDNDAPPTLTISDPTITEGDSGSTTLTFTVSLSAASAKPITVNYSTVDGTATADSDYTAASGILSFAPGQISQTLTMAILGDRRQENHETFSVRLDGATHATLADPEGQATILDNDAPPEVTINDVIPICI
jgi:DNA/RNA endonuclease G (NUC1)/PKD repeat protein